MKLLVIAIFCIGIFFAYRMLVGSVQESYNFCLDQAITAKDSMTGGTCGSKRAIYEDLSSCISEVQKESIGGYLLYDLFGVKSKVNILFAEHNKECPGSSIQAPVEGIYLGN